MRGGSLLETITIQRLVAEKNQYGEVETETYEDKIHTRAEVQYNSGNRVLENSEIFYSYSITFNVRIYHDINELDRVDWEGRKYRIVEIERVKPLQMMRLRCDLIND